MYYYPILTYLSCSLLLVAAVTVQPEHPPVMPGGLSESSFEFPEDPTLHELPPATSEEEQLMNAPKVNWQLHAQGQDPHVRSEDNVVTTDKSVSTEQVDASDASSDCEDDDEQTDSVEMEKLLDEHDELTVTRDGCPTSADRGLTRLILNARPLLPTDRLRNILAHAKEDPEVRDLLRLLRSDQFKERVARLRGTKEEGVLRDYICQGLKLNHAYYIDYVKTFLNVHVPEAPTSPLPNRRKGARGLLQDLRDALPRAQLRDLYRRQLATDKELATAVRRIRSGEFRRLLGNVRNLPEYRAVRSDLEKAGVPMQQLLNLVSNALGWNSLDMGSETIITNF